MNIKKPRYSPYKKTWIFFIGARRIIDVFDCDTHSPEKMTVHQFVRYYMSEEKEEILNVTSLEFSQTGLERLVDCPMTVSDYMIYLK